MKKLIKREKRTAMYLTISIMCGVMLAHESQAGAFKVIRATPSGATPEVSGSSSSSSAVIAVPSIPTRSSSQAVGCVFDKDKEKRFPLDLFKDLNPEGNGLKIEVGPDNGITISSPMLLNVCGGFVPKLGSDADGNIAIQMESKTNLSYAAYIKCLKEEEKLINEKGELDFSKIDGAKFISENWSFPPVAIGDKDKSVAVYYLESKRTASDFKIKETSPKWTPVLTPAGIDKEVNKEDYNCYVPEKVATIQQSPEEVLQEIQKICATGSSEKVRDLRGSLGNYSSIVGSLDKIRLALDASYLEKVLAEENGVKKIYADMKKIEDKLISEKDSLEEAAAEKLVKQYADLSLKLNKDFLDHAIAHIEDLMKVREGLEPEDERIKSIDAEIKNLNEKIGEFSKKRPAAYRALLEVEEKFALTDSAKIIGDVHAKSFLYSQVYAGPKDSSRGSQKLTFTEARDKHMTTMKKFEKNLDDWNDAYQVGKGSTYPLKKTEKERTNAITKMNKRWYDYQQSEYKKYNQYCGIGWTGSVKNPIQCQAFTKGIDKRKNAELKRREKDLKYIASRNEKLGKMGTNYNEYQRRRVAQESDSEEEDESSSDYEATFADTYPEYYATQGASSYDPGQYSMGMQGNMGNMSNQGMYPQMINPQMPVQQGQYQLNWPTI